MASYWFRWPRPASKRYLVFPSLSYCAMNAEIVDLFLVLDAGERHPGAGNLRLRILDVILELSLVPGDAGIPVGVRIGIIRRGTGLAAVQSVELRTDLVPGAFADRVADQAFVERRLAGRDVLRQRRGCGG
jgi:hypothetical protein